MRGHLIFLIAALATPCFAAKECAGDNDCRSGYECKDARDGKSYCYPKEDAPPKKPPGVKKKRVCDKSICGEVLCSTWPVVQTCAKCCWVKEDE